MAEFDDFADDYEERMGPFFGVLAKLKPKEILRHVRGSGLEVGCGLGQYVKELNGLGCEVVGCDISEEMIAEAEKKNGIIGVVCDGAHLPFGDDCFDFAYTVNTLHHAKEPEKILAEMIRVSKGPVVVGELNISNPFVWFFSSVMGIDKNARMFTMKKFDGLLKSGSWHARTYHRSFLLVPRVFLWGVLSKE